MKDDFFNEEEKKKIRDIAIEELAEIVDGINADCDRLEAGGAPADFVRSVTLRVHTIAGSAGLARLMEISRIGAGAESFMRSDNGSDTNTLLNRIRACAAEVAGLLRDAQRNQ